MKLFSALKQKNRLAGELARIQTILVRENSRQQTGIGQHGVHPKKEYLDQLTAELVGKRAALVALKAAIAVANVGIYDKIFEVAELKSQITWIDTLNTKSGVHYEYGYGDAPKDIYYVAYVDDVQRDKLKEEYQARINKIQDEIDEFNSRTDIVIK